MSTRRFDYATFICRAQPFHVGHKEVITKALEIADKVIILIGSTNQPRTIKNPFTFEERKQMILNSFGFNSLTTSNDEPAFRRLTIAPLRDQKYNDQAWAASVQDAVTKACGWTDKPPRGALIGSNKDDSSYYLQMFPQWELVEHAINEEVNATDIRQIYFESNIRYLRDVVPFQAYQFLEDFSRTADFRALAKEQVFIKSYKEKWAAAPYAPTFVTADAVVVQSGHILLIKRKIEPGKGLYALPGGFIKQDERIEDGMIRELREETRLKVPGPVLKGHIKGKEVFDNPDRSLRGRTITQAFYIELDAGKLPVVKGSDDAIEAKWVPLSFVREEEMFEDHYAIIQHFVGNVRAAQ
jgi:bifunctional NMN adenylyltransferase/nudix hydrolase